jgi:hypothetical protein
MTIRLWLLVCCIDFDALKWEVIFSVLVNREVNDVWG